MHHNEPHRRTAGHGSTRPLPAPLRPCAQYLRQVLIQRVGLPAAAGLGLLVATGLIVVATAPLQAPGHHEWHAVTAVTAAMTCFIAVASCIPWRRLPPRAPLVFPAAALVAVTALSVCGDGLGAAYVGIYVLAFVYVGLFTPPHTCWWLLPAAVLTYGPTAGGWSRDISVRLVVVTLMWVLVAEVLAALNSRQRQALHALDAASRTDVLTSLDNRRALQDHLETLPLGVVVVVCDLDHFKRINDTHGHHYGDRVLADFAAVLREALRHGDHAARYGGEEFVLLLQVVPSAVPAVLARLHQRWALTHPLITFSTGWAVHTAFHDAQATVNAADLALYRAKELGRNRDEREAELEVEVAPPWAHWAAAQASRPRAVLDAPASPPAPSLHEAAVSADPMDAAHTTAVPR